MCGVTKEYDFIRKEDNKMSLTEKKHSLNGNREQVNIMGVHALLSSVSKEVVLDTSAGILMVRGKDLKLTCFDSNKGEVEIKGKIDSYTYSN